jgi:hypothetical protein
VRAGLDCAFGEGAVTEPPGEHRAVDGGLLGDLCERAGAAIAMQGGDARMLLEDGKDPDEDVGLLWSLGPCAAV